MSRRGISGVFVGVVVAGLLQVSTSAGTAAPDAAPAKPATARPESGRLSPRLAALAGTRLAKASPQAMGSALSLPAHGAGSLMRRGDRFMVQIKVDSTRADRVGALSSAGARIVHVSKRYHTVTAAVGSPSLRSVAAVRGVTGLMEVLTPMISRTQGTPAVGGPQTSAACPQGDITSEGDAQLRASDERAQLGGTGQGVTVGVLSDSYAQNATLHTTAAQDVASGDLPGVTNPCGATTPVNVLSDTDTTGEDEGRGMLQIVHDLAPGANLAFATAFTSEISFADNIRALKAAGAGVIVDDVTYFDEPFYQDGPVANAVNDVTSQGAVYYSSAANNNIISAGRNVASWEAPAFRPSTCPTGLPSYVGSCMNFSTAGTDPTYGISVANGAQVLLELQWNQPWYGVTTDLDAYLQNSAGVVLAKSELASTDPSVQEPFEIISWTNTTGSPQNVNLAVDRYTGTGGGDAGTPRLKVALLENGRTTVVPNEYTSSTGGDVVGPTIFGHNGAANTVSVAAVPYNNSAAPEYYSSRGPVTQYFGPVSGTTPAAPLPAAQVLAKPDIAATDCGQTTFFLSATAPYRFCGTSAAAPHAAAVAALEKSLNPAVSRAALIASQKTTARAVGSYGPLDVGAGLVDALGATDAVTSRISVALAGTGTGSVSTSDGRISCGTFCSAIFGNGTVVLTAAPVGSSVVSWKGCDAFSGNQCTVSLAADRSITATFTLDTTAPTARMVKPSATVQLGRKVSLQWSGTDTGGSGVKSYSVQVATAKYSSKLGPYQAVSGLTGTTATSATLKEKYGATYCFRVLAQDTVGNVSAYSGPRCTTLPVDDRTLKATHGFKRKYGSTPSHTLSVSTKKGATLTLKHVQARRLGLVVVTCKTCGKVNLYLSGHKVATVDLKSRHARTKVVLAKSFSRIKKGTLTVKATSGKKVQVDGVVVQTTLPKAGRLLGGQQ